MRLAIVGATGAVGTVMRAQLRKRDFPADEIVLFASERSAGKVVDGLTLQPLRDDTVVGFDVAPAGTSSSTTPARGAWTPTSR
jgi:aspartate-semialdehyde dehydrogenase